MINAPCPRLTSSYLAQMRALLILLASSAGLCAAKRTELGFPQLKERIQVAFPENYDSAKKWPAVFYYHGTGGKPTTELMQGHTGNKDWFVVGMTYLQGGNIPATAEYIEKEFQIFKSARKYLAGKWNLDPRRTYVAGFSKGGWMSGFLLQRDPTIAGAIILGAGHNNLIRKPYKFRTKKPIFLGIGRKDPIYPFALRALVHYRPLGAQTTIETWHELGHRFPSDGSQPLRQWLTLQAHPGTNHQAATKWIEERLDEIKGKPNLVDQWVALRDLEETPYLRLLGEKWKEKIQNHIVDLEKGGRVSAETTALKEHRLLLRKELKGHSLPLCQQLAGNYLELSEKHTGTRQAEIALLDHERIKQLAKHFKEQVKIAKDKKDNTFPPATGEEEDHPFPKLPTRLPVIPRNPLIR